MKCKYCKNDFASQVIRRHLNKCIFKPEIKTAIKLVLADRDCCPTISEYDELRKTFVTLPSSKTILNQITNWTNFAAFIDLPTSYEYHTTLVENSVNFIAEWFETHDYLSKREYDYNRPENTVTSLTIVNRLQLDGWSDVIKSYVEKE